MNSERGFSRRSYEHRTIAHSWEEIWEAGPYYDRVSELLEKARHFAVFVGWQIDSRLPLRAPPVPSGEVPARETLKAKILRLCNENSELHAYFLMWNHASIYLIEREWWQTRLWEEIHPRVHFVFDNRHPFGASHHEKICIIDGRVAFCGGIDLCDERWDSPQHLYTDPRRSLDWIRERHGPYHDMAVQVTGPVCEPILEHVRKRWNSLSGIPFPSAARPRSKNPHVEASGGHEVYLSRTQVEGQADFPPRLVREIEFLFREIVSQAKVQILIEGQYYWSREINDVLIAKIRSMKGTPFKVILILSELKWTRSFTKNMEGHELSLLAQLQTAAEESGIELQMGAPYVSDSGPGSSPPLRPIYVHSKVIIIDDRFLSIGSANLATRALRVDTELGITLVARSSAEQAHIRRVTKAILDHWGFFEEYGGEARSVYLRRIKPALALAQMREVQWIAPWRPVFDPNTPWLRGLKRRVQRIVGIKRGDFGHGTLRAQLFEWLAASLSTLGLILITGTNRPTHLLPIAALLSSVGVFPIPFFSIVALLGVKLGPAKLFLPSLFALWSAAAIRYVMTRAYPNGQPLARFPRTPLDRRLGRRNLRLALLAMADPRDGTHRKLNALGRYCIPFPWFLACMTVVFPILLGATIAFVNILLHALLSTMT